MARLNTQLSPARSEEASSSTSPSRPTPSAANGRTSSSAPKKIATRKPPLQPTPVELLLLAIYPTTLIVGSLYSILNPTTRNAPYDASSQSHYPETAPSYFAQKTNLFNVLFVKKGWLWITIGYFVFLFSHPFTGPARSLTVTPRRIQGVLRWAMVTLWWILVTQWFFGPAIIDRGFLLTGGYCDVVRRPGEMGDMGDAREFITSIACKAVGGKWKGGHDISGHVFLLVLGSLFLLGEVVHVLLRSSRQPEERTILMSDGAVKSAEVEAYDRSLAEMETGRHLNISVQIVLGISGLSIWMLLMTATFFHTWFEKLTGLLVALSGIFVVHFLPRSIPALRSIVGLPGV